MNSLFSILYSIFSRRLLLTAYCLPLDTAYAHCDYPCGIYDPHAAQIGALTVIRMMDLMAELEKEHHDHDIEFRNSMIRAVNIKEEHAELVKREIRVIWGDYFKPELAQKYPELSKLVYEIMSLASKTKQTVERATAQKLLERINRFAEIFWETKGKQTKRVKAPYKPEAEIIVPVLE